jgi:hypothetical protein
MSKIRTKKKKNNISSIKVHTTHPYINIWKTYIYIKKNARERETDTSGREEERVGSWGGGASERAGALEESLEHYVPHHPSLFRLRLIRDANEPNQKHSHPLPEPVCFLIAEGQSHREMENGAIGPNKERV